MQPPHTIEDFPLPFTGWFYPDVLPTEPSETPNNSTNLPNSPSAIIDTDQNSSLARCLFECLQSECSHWSPLCYRHVHICTLLDFMLNVAFCISTTSQIHLSLPKTVCLSYFLWRRNQQRLCIIVSTKTTDRIGLLK